MSAESGNKDTELTELLLSWAVETTSPSRISFRSSTKSCAGGAPLHAMGTAWPYASDNGSRPRNLPAASGVAPRPLEEPLALHGGFGATHAPYPRRLRPVETRVKRGGDLPRVTLDEGLHQAAAPGSRLRSPGRRAHRAFGLRCPQGSRGRASLLRRPELRGDRSRSGGVRRYRSARLEDCQGLLTPNRW